MDWGWETDYYLTFCIVTENSSKGLPNDDDFTMGKF